MRIVIRKVPPTEHLEGIDLRRYQFREGQIYEVGRHLGKMLVVWGYAELAAPEEDSDPGADEKPGD